MKENKDTFAPFIEDDEPIDDYIERMSKNSEWGGNLEIYALSMLLEANFYIYIYEHPMYIVKNFEKPKKNIMLTYHDGQHYNSLRKLEEKNNEDKEKEEKRKKEKENEENEENEESEDNEEDEKDINDDVNDLIKKVDTLNIQLYIFFSLNKINYNYELYKSFSITNYLDIFIYRINIKIH